MTPQKYEKIYKGAFVTTYLVAILCLLVGLFVPLYGPFGAGKDDLLGAMMFTRIPAALNAAIGVELIPLSGIFLPKFGRYFVEQPTLIFGANAQLFAWLLLLYAFVCVLSIVMLFPVIFGKKDKKTSATCAYIVEAIAMFVMSIYLVFALIECKPAGGLPDMPFYNILIAFVGIVLTMFVQAVATKGNLGVMKIIIFILTILSFVTLLDLDIFASRGKVSALKPVAKIFGIPYTFTDFNPAVHGFKGFRDLMDIGSFADIFSQLQAMGILMLVLIIIMSTFTVLNIFIDTLGLAIGTKYDKNGRPNPYLGTKIFSLIRYAFVFLCSVAAIVLFFLSTANAGLLLYAFAAITFLQTLLCLIRVIRAVIIKKRNENTPIVITEEAKEEDAIDEEEIEIEEEIEEPSEEELVDEEELLEEEEIIEEEPSEEELVDEEELLEEEEIIEEEPVEEEVVEEEVIEEEPVEEEIIEEEPVEEVPVEEEGLNDAYEEPVQEQLSMMEPEQREETHTYVYNYRTVYHGPSDTFMDTLDDSEKIEFVKVFIERSKGNLSGIPIYEIGENNYDFFPSVFIHLGKVRDAISPELLAKIYKRTNSLR